MGKGRRIKAQKRAERARKNAIEAWWADEMPLLVHGEGAACPQCDGPTFLMSAPVPILRCNGCDWQGFPMIRSPAGALMVPDEEGDMCPAEQDADGTVRVQRPNGVVQIDTTGQLVSIVRSTGAVRYAFTGHLIEAVGDCAHYARTATRPPRCSECGEPWTTWHSVAASRKHLLDHAKRLDVPLYEIRCGGDPWWMVHGVGGRSYECLSCRHNDVVPTMAADDDPRPSGDHVVLWKAAVS